MSATRVALDPGSSPGWRVGWGDQKVEGPDASSERPSLFSREGGSPVWVPAFAGKQGSALSSGDQNAAVSDTRTLPPAIDPVPSCPRLKLGCRYADSRFEMSVSTYATPSVSGVVGIT